MGPVGARFPGGGRARSGPYSVCGRPSRGAGRAAAGHTFFLNLLDVTPGAAGLLEPLQKAMQTVQPILLQYEGSLKEVIVDDKGLTIVAVFGLPPLAHEDDPTRAARAALVTQKALGDLGMRCAIGLATGQAFCGPVCQLQADARRTPPARAAGPGGQTGNVSASSAAGSHPEHQFFGQTTPEPAPTVRPGSQRTATARAKARTGT
jgi:hypothetical protein